MTDPEKSAQKWTSETGFNVAIGIVPAIIMVKVAIIIGYRHKNNSKAGESNGH
jgi:hypothetical protein